MSQYDIGLHHNRHMALAGNDSQLRFGRASHIREGIATQEAVRLNQYGFVDAVVIAGYDQYRALDIFYILLAEIEIFFIEFYHAGKKGVPLCGVGRHPGIFRFQGCVG